MDPARFNAAGYWDQPPRPWDDLTPERLAASGQIRVRLASALDELPDAQGRTVVSYIPPSQQLSGFGDVAVDQIAKMLDDNLAKMVGMLGK